MKVIEKSISPVDIESRRDIAIQCGDTVRVHQKIVVGKDKTRIQVFEGIVIAVKHKTEPGATFTVRRVGTDGVAVEKIFPLYSPMIDAIEVTRRGRVRRSRLYFLRGMSPRRVREKLRRAIAVQEKTTVESQRNKEEVEVDEEVVTDASTQDVVEETPQEETTEEAPKEAPESTENKEEPAEEEGKEKTENE